MLGDPVTGMDFFDREDILSLLRRRAEDMLKGNKRNIAMIGIRKTGKTSILLQFKQYIEANPRVLAVYIYIRPESIRSFLYKMAGSALFEYLKKNSEVSTHDLEALMREAERFVPRTINQILRLQKLIELGDKDEEVFEGILLIPKILSEEAGQSIIVMLDEFQRFADYPVKHVFDTFREKIMLDKEIMYIVTGSAVTMMEQILATEASPLYGHFEVVRVGFFDYNTAKSFLQDKLRGYKAKETFLSFLISITNGNPYYLDILSYRIKDILKLKNLGTLSDAILIEALAEELLRASGTIYLHLKDLIAESLEKRGYSTYISILSAIADGRHSITHISEALHRPPPNISKQVTKMIEEDIVYKIGSKYFLYDPLLAIWLKYVYPLREESFIPELDIKRNEFEAQIGQLFSLYKEEISKDNKARIIELIRAFDGNLRIQGKPLPRFNEVEARTIDGGEFDALARINNDYWGFEISNENVNTLSIEEFCKKIKGIESRYSVKEKVLIFLKNIDPKARLYAGKEGIQLWDIQDIHSLMLAYSKFPILCTFRTPSHKNDLHD